jgi:uncharacterized membrane protein
MGGLTYHSWRNGLSQIWNNVLKEGSKLMVRVIIAVCLILAGAFVSGVLLAEHHGITWAESAVHEACSEEEEDGCEEVAQSQWSAFMGIPVAAYGLVFYLSIFVLLALSLFASSGLRNVMSAIALVLLALGLVIDLYLFALQAFVIHAYCKVCIYTYFLSAGAFIALFPARRAFRNFLHSISDREGRLALAGWVLGSIAFTAFVLGINAMLYAKYMYNQAMELF